MNPKGKMGWLLLALALLVPAVMFWNWWNALDSRPKEAARKPSGGPVFGEVAMAAKLPNPMSAPVLTVSSTVALARQEEAPRAPAVSAPPAPPPPEAAKAPPFRRDPTLSPQESKLARTNELRSKLGLAGEVQAPAIEKKVRLQGITLTQSARLAIVNDQVLREGQSLSNGVRVEKILQNTVIFKFKGKTFAKRLK